MTAYRFEVDGKGVVVDGFSLGYVINAITKLVVRNEIPEGARCELWARPRGKWHLVDGWVYRKERWT